MATDNPDPNSEGEQGGNSGGSIIVKVGCIEVPGLKLREVYLQIKTASDDWLFPIVIGLLLLAVVVAGVVLPTP